MRDQQGEHPTRRTAIQAIAPKIGCSAEALRTWVRRAETDAGERPGLTTDERERLKALDRENREVRRANEARMTTPASLRMFPTP